MFSDDEDSYQDPTKKYADVKRETARSKAKSGSSGSKRRWQEDSENDATPSVGVGQGYMDSPQRPEVRRSKRKQANLVGTPDRA